VKGRKHWGKCQCGWLWKLLKTTTCMNNTSNIKKQDTTMLQVACILLTMKVGIWPLLWSSGQSSWLQIKRSGFDSQRYQIFREVVGLERSPLSLVSTLGSYLEETVAAPV
jgi:hypothetical protein